MKAKTTVSVSDGCVLSIGGAQTRANPWQSVVLALWFLLANVCQGSLTWINNPATGSQYALTEPMTWLEAEALGVANGGHLVTINDGVENAWLITNVAQSLSWAWIGMNDVAEEGSWGWLSGEAVSYTNWHSGEPNDWGGEDYGLIVAGANADPHFPLGSWIDHAGPAYQGILEKTSGVPDGGATFMLLGMAMAGITSLRRRFHRLV